MRPHFLRVRARFLVLVLASVGLLAFAVGALTFRDTRSALLAATQAQLSDLTQAQAARLDGFLATVSGRVLGLADSLSARPFPDQKTVLAVLRSELKKDAGIFGMSIAFAPHALDPDRRDMALYVHRSPQGLKTVRLDTSQYKYSSQPWFQIPSLLGRPVWSEPYFDEGGGGVVMTTFSAPVFRKGKLYCVVTADISMADLGRKVALLPVMAQGWSFVITHMGTFLAAPQKNWVMRESIFSLAEAAKRPDLRILGRRMIRGAVGLTRITDWTSGRTVWLGFAPVKDAGWSFGAVVAEEEILAGAWRLARRQGLIALAGLAALVVLVWLLAASFTRPLTRMARAVGRLAGGDFTVKVAGVRPGDEIGDLANGFNRMAGDLTHYVEQLTVTTAAKERIESELDLARQIQESILPQTYPAYPEYDEFDLFGHMIPARQVGGDFYDYFMVDEDHLGLVVGDVSGKGVPSALFMTVARTLIKSAAGHYSDPAAVLDATNRQILPGNEMCMFVTVFFGVYQLSTGRLSYVSAGHPAPLLCRGNGPVVQMERLTGMAVGVHDDLGLEMGHVDLEVGDIMLVFTDGLDEALSPAGEMFGLDRAKDWLHQAEVTDAPLMIQDLNALHDSFTADTERFDDLTLLLLRRTA